MHRYVRSGLLFLAVVTAIGVFVAGFVVSTSGGGAALPTDVERIAPSDGALVSPQADVFVDLVDTDTGVLLIDGKEMPQDQLTVVDPLGQLSYSPGPGKEIERFRAGTHHVAVVYWSKDRTRASGHTFTWSFRVG